MQIYALTSCLNLDPECNTVCHISCCGLLFTWCSAVSVAAVLSTLQARPAIKLPENEEDDEKENEEEEKDLSIPGSSYAKLMTLTPASVLPGKLQNDTHIEVRGHVS